MEDWKLNSSLERNSFRYPTGVQSVHSFFPLQSSISFLPSESRSVMEWKPAWTSQQKWLHRKAAKFPSWLLTAWPAGDDAIFWNLLKVITTFAKVSTSNNGTTCSSGIWSRQWASVSSLRACPCWHPASPWIPAQKCTLPFWADVAAARLASNWRETGKMNNETALKWTPVGTFWYSQWPEREGRELSS